MKGLIIVKPHGEMIADGTKTMIVKSVMLTDLIGRPAVLVEGDVGLGEIKLKEPREIDLAEFDKLRDQHQISDNERRRWWPDAKKLYAYGFEFKAYDKPKRVARERGPQIVVSEVVFKSQQYYDLIKRIFGKTLGDYSDQDLVQVHRLLHIFFDRKTGGEKVVIEGQPRSVEDIINRHVLVVQEMGRRGFEHHEDEDELNRLSKPFMQKELAPVYPSGAGDGKVKARVEDIFKYFDKPIILHKGAVVFTGGIVNNGQSDNDLDILARIPSLDELLRRLYFRLIRSLPEGHPLRENLHMIGNDPSGPFTSFIPAYDLALIPGDMKVIRMSQDEESLDIVKQRAASEKVKEEAQTSLKDDAVKPMRFFLPMKPTKGAQPEQRQSIDNFISLFKEDDFPVYSSKKYDGARHVVSILGGKVKIMSEDGEDNTDRFPSTIETIKKLKVGSGAVLDCEVEKWTPEGQHLPREAVAAYVHSIGDPDDSSLVFNIFDILWLDGVDLHKKPFEERWNKLRGIGIREETTEEPDLEQRLNLAPHFRSTSLQDLKDQTVEMLDKPASEGNVAKKSTSVYYLDGNSREGWIKFHKSAVLTGIVVERIETKTAGTFNYRFALEAGDEKVSPETIVDVDGKEYVEVGKTFSTSIKAEVGQLVEIEFETFNWTVDADGLITVSAWAPRVMQISEDDSPDNIDEVYHAADDQNVLQVKQIYPQGETIYKVLNTPMGTKSAVLGNVKKQIDPYMVSPNEDEKYSYVCQHHYRGKSAHVDLRAENQDKKFLIGWTIADLIPDAIKKPVETLQDAKVQDAINANWKINWKTGKFKDRETRAGNVAPAQLRAFEKAPEPIEWLNVQGVTGPFPAPGATKEFRGVFSIIDKGRIEYGGQKLDFHEYILSGGKLNGRLTIRRLPRETFAESFPGFDPKVDLILSWQHYLENYLDEVKKVWGDHIKEDAFWLNLAQAAKEDYGLIGRVAPDLMKVLPSGVEEGSMITSTFWVAIQPIDQTPIVLSQREVDKKWMPPDGISALPEAARSKVPAGRRYWNMTGEAARQARDQLVSEMSKAQTAKFVLQFHGFRTPGKKPVRQGMSEYHWDFRLDKGGKTLDHFILENNPLTANPVSATFKLDEWKDALTYEGNPTPGTPMNPTKDMASTVSILASGKLTILIDDPTFKKYDIREGDMKGLWIAQRDDEKTLQWRFGKSRMVEAT